MSATLPFNLVCSPAGCGVRRLISVLGMVATATRTIKENLDRIPDEDGRTKVAIICFDTSLYFFSLPQGTTEASMLVVSDIDDVFLPKPNDLLVNLAEARESMENLLDKIGNMFQENSIIGSALGPALQAGFKLMVRGCISIKEART